jgi:hypothetical protein
VSTLPSFGAKYPKRGVAGLCRADDLTDVYDTLAGFLAGGALGLACWVVIFVTVLR